MEKTNQQPATPKPTAPAQRPNEAGVVRVEGFVRIFDPNTKETLVEKRA